MKNKVEELKNEVKGNIYNAMENLQQIDLQSTTANLEYMLAALYSLREAYNRLDTKEGAEDAAAPE